MYRRLGRRGFKSKWRLFDLGVRKSGLQEVSYWHHVTVDLESPSRPAMHWHESWDYRSSINLDHPIFNEIGDGDTIVARTCLGIEDFCYVMHYIMHEIRMEVIGVDVCAELRPISFS
jgi:hypothetical protein